MGDSPILGPVDSLTSKQRVAEVRHTAPVGHLHQIVEGLVGHRLAGEVDPQVADPQHETLRAAGISAHQLGEADIGHPHLFERTTSHREDHTERWTPPVVASAP